MCVSSDVPMSLSCSEAASASRSEISVRNFVAVSRKPDKFFALYWATAVACRSSAKFESTCVPMSATSCRNVSLELRKSLLLVLWIKEDHTFTNTRGS